MFRDKFCSIRQQVHSRHRRTNSQFLKNIKHEEQKCKAVRAHEILMTAENPMVKEQKVKDQISRELKELEREKFLEEKRKALLHENEDEVRQLDVLIKRAHIQRELTEQKAFKENQTKEELQKRLEENKNFEEECKRNAELALEEERKNAEKKAAFRQDLLKQMEDKDKLLKMERETIKKERESMKRFLENLQQDTENERQEMLKLKEMAKKERDDYLQQIQQFKEQQKSEAQEDHRNYMEIMQQKDEAKRLRAEKRKINSLRREELSERIGQQVYSIQKEKQKRTDLLLELLVEERLAKDDERYKKNLEKQLQAARSLRQDFQTYHTLRQQEKLFKQQEETDISKNQQQFFQEQERKETEIKNIKIQKNRQYCQELLSSIQNRIREHEFAVSEGLQEYKQQLALQAKRQQDIEAEKLRLLRAEPLEVLKFLPVKAISDEHRAILGLTCKETNEKFKLENNLK